MPHNLKDFDDLKKKQSNIWEYISVYNIEKIEDLILDCFKAYRIAVLKKGLRLDLCFQKLVEKIIHLYSDENKDETIIYKNLEFFLRR